MGVGDQPHAPAVSTPGKTRYPLYRRLGGPQDRSGRAVNLVPTGIRSRTVQPVVSRYTDWAIPAHTSEIILSYILTFTFFTQAAVTKRPHCIMSLIPSKFLQSIYYPTYALRHTQFMTYRLHVSAQRCHSQGVIITKVCKPTCQMIVKTCTVRIVQYLQTLNTLKLFRTTKTQKKKFARPKLFLVCFSRWLT